MVRNRGERGGAQVRCRVAAKRPRKSQHALKLARGSDESIDVAINYEMSAVKVNLEDGKPRAYFECTLESTGERWRATAVLRIASA